MKTGDFVEYKGDLYQIISIDWSSLANRFQLKPIACFSPEKLHIFSGNAYLNNSEEIKPFNGTPPKYSIGQRVKHNSYNYTVRFIVIKNNSYYYQIKGEEDWLSLAWFYESELY